jgi:hypothetical protein
MGGTYGRVHVRLKEGGTVYFERSIDTTKEFYKGDE